MTPLEEGLRRRVAGSTSIRGFDVAVRLDRSWSWFVPLALFTTCAVQMPAAHPELGLAVWTGGGLFVVLGFLLSLWTREQVRAIAARTFGAPRGAATLFPFGAVEDAPPAVDRAAARIGVTAAGAAASAALAALLWIMAASIGTGALLRTAVLDLALLNAVLAGLGLLPVRPFDGGRVLRALRRARTESATHVTADLGKLLGAVLQLLGILQLIRGELLAATWLFASGACIVRAAREGYGFAEPLTQAGLRDRPGRKVGCSRRMR